MNERITESKLRGMLEPDVHAPAPPSEDVGLLVDDVRRLWGLIVDYDTGAGGEPCYAMETGCRCRNCRALEAEARAIREEG